MTFERSRREFLQRTGHAASVTAAVSVLGGVHSAEAAEPTRLGLGIIGCGGIMGHHLNGLVSRREAVEIAWLCDVDPRQIEKSKVLVQDFQAQGPKCTSRYEDVLQDKNIDAVVIATPHHWHAPIALAAMENGKDVYIEKPISHVFDEGPAIIEAARTYRRVVQQGSQMRSSPVTRKAEKILADGMLGEIKVTRAWTAEQRRIVKPVPDSSPPQGVDYDRWLGPAPQRQFNPLRFHSTWRMFRDYGNGEIGDDGIHDIDMAVWALGVTTLPTTITARGGRMMLHGHASEYPDNMHAIFDYPDGKQLIYENYPFTSYGLYGFDNGNVFYGTEGYMVFSRRGAFQVFMGPKEEPGPTEGREIRGQRGYAEHMADFLDAVRNRRMDTAASPEKAHLSCGLVHLGEATYRTRGRLEFDVASGTFADCADADALLTKSYRPPYQLPVQEG